MTDHPITPPPELVEDWIELAKPLPQRPPNPGELATLAAQWGSDQELEACCHLLRLQGFDVVDDLRTVRRPKPPSLKKRALKILEEEPEADDMKELIVFDTDQVNIIRRALEQLDD